jgi:quercetin dioxygenase-like cupin family protein
VPLPRPGCVGVEAKVLLRRAGLSIAMLRFAAQAAIDEHSASFEIDVVCLEGAGYVSVGGESHALTAGQSITWPANMAHRLWTSGSPMTTLMIEHNVG